MLSPGSRAHFFVGEKSPCLLRFPPSIGSIQERTKHEDSASRWGKSGDFVRQVFTSGNAAFSAILRPMLTITLPTLRRRPFDPLALLGMMPVEADSDTTKNIATLVENFTQTPEGKCRLI